MLSLSKYVDLQKLRHEWKTFAVASVGALVGFYDLVVANNLDWTPLIPDHAKPYAVFGIPATMLVLRKWKSENVLGSTAPNLPKPDNVSDHGVQ